MAKKAKAKPANKPVVDTVVKEEKVVDADNTRRTITMAEIAAKLKVTQVPSPKLPSFFNK